MEKYDLLKQAYSDENFGKLVQEKRLIIETELSKFIKSVNDRNKVGLKIFENLESRVKGVESFCEKINRKNYIHEWDIPKEKLEIQNYIARNLPDLIGFRINCFFYEDEKTIYDELKEYYERKKFEEEFYLNFNENKKQANNHLIYKVTGNYENMNFEIQIKCSVHNIWGEVEHSRVYKSEHYDPKVNSKKIITEEVFKILKSSDQQLMTIFEENYTIDDLVKSLFYQYTYKSITESVNTKILSNHYQHFFDIFKDPQHTVNIKKFVSHKLVEKNYSKEQLAIEEPSYMTNDEFVKRYIPFEINVLYGIASLIYDNLDKVNFIDYLIKLVENSAIDEDEFSVPEDEFGPEKKEKREDMQRAIIAVYDKFFNLREELKNESN